MYNIKYIELCLRALVLVGAFSILNIRKRWREAEAIICAGSTKKKTKPLHPPVFINNI
jgi:hypothetical protein